jgi:hypothetical protein
MSDKILDLPFKVRAAYFFKAPDVLIDGDCFATQAEAVQCALDHIDAFPHCVMALRVSVVKTRLRHICDIERRGDDNRVVITSYP